MRNQLKATTPAGLALGLSLLLGTGWYLYTRLLRNGLAHRWLRRVRPLPRTEAWREDLHFLANRMVRIHPNLFHSLSPRAFEEAVHHIEAHIPGWTDEEIVVALIKLVARPSYVGGRDGHLFLPLHQAATGFRILPLRLYQFSDGWFIIDARETHEALIGTRLTHVDDTAIDEVVQRVEPLVARDNASTVKARIAEYCLSPELLRTLGIVEQTDSVRFTVDSSDKESPDKAGQTNHSFSKALHPITWAEYDAWQQPAHEPESFALRYLENPQTLLVEYNAVRDRTRSGETMQQFCRRLASFVSTHTVKRVVVDLRENGGGNNATYRPLLALLRRNKLINQPGKLFLITGRKTFSAAGNFVAEVDRDTSALIAGEPMGGGINQYGDSLSVMLPNSGLVAKIASRYWQMGKPDDERLTLEPDVPVALSSADFFAGRDPVLEAILDF